LTYLVWQVALAFAIPALVGSLAKDVLDIDLDIDIDKSTYTYIHTFICSTHIIEKDMNVSFVAGCSRLFHSRAGWLLSQGRARYIKTYIDQICVNIYIWYMYIALYNDLDVSCMVGSLAKDVLEPLFIYIYVCVCVCIYI